MTVLTPTSMTWAEVLAHYKLREQRQLVLTMANSAVMQRLVTVWPSICDDASPAVKAERWEPRNPRRAVSWAWLWWTRFPNGIPRREWADAADVMVLRYWDLIENVVTMKLVYPDGGVHTTCLGYLHHKAVQAFK